jgi:hypothetical protein
MNRNVLLLARGLALAALALSLGGCGKRQYDVTGKVTYNGAVLAKPNGQIVFVGPDGSQVAAEIGLDGTYKATKVTAGLNRVAVYYRNPSFKKMARPKGRVDPSKRPPTNNPQYLIPEAYASHETSKIEVEVTGVTDVNINLKGPEIP